MKNLLITGLILLIPASVSADEIINPKELEKKTDSKEAPEDKGGSLGGLEVVSLLTLAGASVYFTRKKKM